jgi:hypothetical protein
MNTGVEDALALSWRLASVIRGHGGPQLLSSYTTEQRPIMVRRLKRSQRHVLEHIPRVAIATEVPGLLHEQSPAGKELRRKLTAYIDESGSECLDRGIELDSRYKSSIIYQDSDGSPEPEWHLKRYTPSTRPGSRAPHVFLNSGDGKTSILDLYGKQWTLVSFCDHDTFEVDADSSGLASIATSRNIPLQIVCLSKVAEPLARQLWERDFVLVRADGHVAWRGNEMPNEVNATEIWDVVLGWKSFPGYVEPPEPDVGFMLEMTGQSKSDGEGKNVVEGGIRNGELAFE